MAESIGNTAPENVEKGLRDFLQLLREPPITYFPIRHHSPACSWHLRKIILERQPASILVEGPETFNELLPLLLDPGAIYPLAVYSTYLDKQRKIVEKRDPKDLIPPFFSAYYPFCDYSPELTALRVGNEAGARVRFIDLPYHQQLLADKSIRNTEEFWKTASLLAESHLNRSEYVNRLAASQNRRDHDDLWDHLFEADFQTKPSDVFLEELSAFCYMSRSEYDPQALDFDGTLAREEKMAWEIQRELQTATGKPGEILVVTGGFHTANLPFLLQKTVKEPKVSPISREDGQTVLIPYSFDQLDALNGYASGMPSPYYYDLVWAFMQEGSTTPFADALAELLVSIGRLTRDKNLPFALSPADEIVAFNQALDLARLREHTEPTREDFLDAVRSCFVKGAMDAEGVVLLNLVGEMLSGNKVGRPPAGAAAAPIVEDFREILQKLRLNSGTSERREMTLDVYRKARHRKISRFFWQLDYLEIPFGRLLAGPDFIMGFDLNKINEVWEYAWAPQCESQLVKASIYGVTVAEAARRKLVAAADELDKDGKGRSSLEVVRHLLLALQMGLHKYAGNILQTIREKIAEDNNFGSLIGALTQLVLINKSRETLEGHNLPELPLVIETIYQKACYLIQDLPFCPEEEIHAVIKGFCVLAELLAGNTEENLDATLFLDNLEVALEKREGHSGIVAGAAGILYREGRLGKEELLKLFTGYVGGSSKDNHRKTGFVYGLLQTCRELTWNHSWLLETLDRLLQDWDEDDFINSLPELRLAFADLTPNETDRVAATVARLHGEEDLGDLVFSQVSENEVQQNLAINKMLVDALTKDGLGEWLR